jgi:hypothetical protein
MTNHIHSKTRRINIYIDGYNFYYSISKSSGRSVERLKRGWCDFSMLSQKLVAKAFPGGKVGAVKYFTAPVGEFQLSPDEERRQNLWLDALRAGTNDSVVIIKGFYAREEGKQRVEKQTDTNIAISMVRDSLMSPDDPRHQEFRGDPFASCNGVILVSGDRDLHPALKMISHYGVTPVVFRPGRELSDDDLYRCMLPDPVVRRDGSRISWDDYTSLKVGRW